MSPKEDFYFDDFEDEGNDSNLKEQLDHYLVHWRWFLACGVLGLLLAFLYLRYTTPIYQAVTTIMVKDEKKGGMLSELSAFSDLGLGSGMANNVDNEVEILKSRTLVTAAVQQRHLNIDLALKGKVVDRKIYGETPIQVHFLATNTAFALEHHEILWKEAGKNGFTLEEEPTASERWQPIVMHPKTTYRFGEKIATRLGTLVITQNSYYPTTASEEANEGISIQINPIAQVVAAYQNSLTVEPISKTSSVVSVSVKDAVPAKAEDFLNTLIQIYNEDAAEDKNFISENTSKFIAARLALITQELEGVEKEVETFKTANQLTDIESEAKLFIEGSSDYEKQSVGTAIQLNVVTSLLDFLKKSTNADLLPTNLIADKGEASSLMNDYNQLVLDRNRVLKSATPENPTVKRLDQQIAALKGNVGASLKRLYANLQIENRDVKNQEARLNSKIVKIPGQERQFRVIARQQKVKEELYLYLLQKREETAISLAATEPNARVIDAAMAGQLPVSPKKNIIYLAGLLLGVLVPFGVIYGRGILDNKIHSRLDLEGKTKIPFIGDVPTSEEARALIQSESRSSSAEAIRIVRTNLEFMLNQVPKGKAKTIFVTSTLPNEGKTLVSVNLATTFALSEKKVLLVGIDIRNPKFEDYFDLPKMGLTNYLSSGEDDIEPYIVKHKSFKNFYILPSGIIPPNPVELLMSSKVETLFETLKATYDYIIVDTAPVSLVADTQLVAQNADSFVYVIRANVLEKRMLAIPNTFYQEKKLPNMCLLLNDTKAIKGYGYGYGYGLKATTQPWYRKIKLFS
jgi:tyrosine-protein kinase Etk/Wzc